MSLLQVVQQLQGTGTGTRPVCPAAQQAVLQVLNSPVCQVCMIYNDSRSAEPAQCWALSELSSSRSLCMEAYDCVGASMRKQQHRQQPLGCLHTRLCFWNSCLLDLQAAPPSTQYIARLVKQLISAAEEQHQELSEPLLELNTALLMLVSTAAGMQVCAMPGYE